MSAKLLIVDHSAQNLLVLGGLLHDDYEVHAARHGAEVLKRAIMLDPELILLDAAIPDIEALSLLAQLRADIRTADIPVIFILSGEDAEQAAHCIACGAADYLLRPYHPALVKARIRQHVELKRANAALITLIRTDELTQVANRRAFQETLLTEWKRCARASTYLSLVLVQIDRFEAYSHRHGTAAGSACIQEIAACIAMSVYREPDLVARYGNTRFACLLPETSPVGAIHVAEYLRDGLADLRMKADRRVTLSQGIATLIPDLHSSSNELLAQAERALLAAQDQGGDRICDQDDLKTAARALA